MKQHKGTKPTRPAAGQSPSRRRLPSGGASDGDDARSERHEQLTEDRVGAHAGDRAAAGEPVGAASSANSVSADPYARMKALGEPVPQVTRHI